MKPSSKGNIGYTLVEIMIVVAIVGLLAAIAIPNFVKTRVTSQQTACIANLRQIKAAKLAWALEVKKSGSDIPTDGDLFGATLYLSAKPQCPGGGTYTLNAMSANPTCSQGDHTL